MADITDPGAIAFTNEVIRPMCELLRAAKVRAADAKTTWFAGMNAKFPNDSSPLQDGRDVEGVSRLTGADVNGVMSILIGELADNAGLNDEIVSRPCVRPLSAS